MKQALFVPARWAAWGLAAVVGVLAGQVRADTVVMTNNIVYAQVRVIGVQAGKLLFSIEGRDLQKPLADIKRLTVDGEAAFTAAEESYVTGRWDKATDAYEKTLNTTQKPWLRDWCTIRLLESSGKAGRFDVTVRTLIQLAEKSPESAAAVPLTIPGPKSTYLADGIRLLEAATRKANQKDRTNEVLLRVLADLYAAKDDAKGKADAEYRLAELAAKADPNSPAAQRAAVAVKLNRIREALSGRRYDQVVQMVHADAASFIEPADQAEALFLLAEAAAGKASGSKDAGTWKEVAVAYMRVVAHGPTASPRVPESLLKTAAICDKQLHDRPAARRIYQQIQEEYKDQPAAREAEKEAGAMGEER